MELRLYLRMLLHGWWIIALTMLSAMIIALTVSYLAVPQYLASARLIISPNVTAKTTNEVMYGLDILDKRSIVTTSSEVLNSRRIYVDALTTLKLSADVAEKYTRRVVVLPDSNIIDLSITGPDPKMATLLANTMGQRSIDYVNGLYQKVYELSFLDPATVPTVAVSPQPVRDTGLALMLGLLAGMVLAILSEQLRLPFQALMRSTQMDPTSSVYNRTYFQSMLKERLHRQPNQMLAFGVVQMDGLEDVIENQPKPITTPMLRQITLIMRNELRGNDVIGRWSEDTFAILLPSTAGPAATATFERIAKALSNAIEIKEESAIVQFVPYVGFATRHNSQSADTLISEAEAALKGARDSEVSVNLYVNTAPESMRG